MAKKSAGAGRGFVNPQRLDESDEDYVSPAAQYAMEKQQEEANTQKKTEAAQEAAKKDLGMKKGGMTVRGWGKARGARAAKVY